MYTVIDCPLFSVSGHTVSSSIPLIETSPRTYMSKETTVRQSSGLIQPAWSGVAVSAKSKIGRLQQLVEDNVGNLKRSWNEYFGN